MWKSGFLLRDATLFYPQPNWGKEELFNMPLGDKCRALLFHRKVFHIPQPLWKYSLVILSGTKWSRRIRSLIISNRIRILRLRCTLCSFAQNDSIYSKLLIFAVMSRMLFCIVMLPLFSSVCTLLMECSTVV